MMMMRDMTFSLWALTFDIGFESLKSFHLEAYLAWFFLQQNEQRAKKLQYLLMMTAGKSIWAFF